MSAYEISVGGWKHHNYFVSTTHLHLQSSDVQVAHRVKVISGKLPIVSQLCSHDLKGRPQQEELGPGCRSVRHEI